MGQQKKCKEKAITPHWGRPTQVPARASARPEQTVLIRPRYIPIADKRGQEPPENRDVTQFPTQPPPQPSSWQYESPEFEVESSVSSLSLVLAETSPALYALPVETSTSKEAGSDEVREHTRGNMASPLSGSTPEESLSDYGERSLLRPALSALQRDTPIPPLLSEISSISDEAQPWTTGKATNSVYARRLVEQSRVQSLNEVRQTQSWPRPGGSFKFGWLDAARWWLLYPGRMEFLLWIIASLLLVVVTGALIVAALWSLGWLHLAS